MKPSCLISDVVSIPKFQVPSSKFQPSEVNNIPPPPLHEELNGRGLSLILLSKKRFIHGEVGVDSVSSTLVIMTGWFKLV